MVAAEPEQAGGHFHAGGIESGGAEEVEANPEAPVRVDHMVVEAIDDHRAVVGRRQHERDFAALMVRHWSHAQPEQRPQNHFSSYRVWIVDFALVFRYDERRKTYERIELPVNGAHRVV